MRRTEHPPLTLTCSGCGATAELDRDAALLPGVRPFVEVHRACTGAEERDDEMRTAFTRSA